MNKGWITYGARMKKMAVNPPRSIASIKTALDELGVSYIMFERVWDDNWHGRWNTLPEGSCVWMTFKITIGDKIGYLEGDNGRDDLRRAKRLWCQRNHFPFMRMRPETVEITKLYLQSWLRSWSDYGK